MLQNLSCYIYVTQYVFSVLINFVFELIGLFSYFKSD